MNNLDQPNPVPDLPAPIPKRTWLGRLGSIFWNRHERRVRALWRILAVAGAITGTGLAIRATGLLPESGTRAFVVVGTVVRAIVALAVVGLLGRLLDRRRLREFGLHINGDWLLDLIFGLVLGAGLMSGVFLIELGLGWLEITGAYRTTVPGEPFGWAILAPAVLFTGVAIVEELLARGYLLRNVAEGLAFGRLGGPRGGLIVACLISSALFALGHASNPNTSWVSTVNIGVAGVFLALGYILTGQLGIPIGLHISWNFFQASVYGFPVSGMSRFRTSFVATGQTGPELWTGGAFGPEAGLLGLAAMLTGTGLTLLWVRWRRGEVRLVARLAEPPAPESPDSVTPAA